MFHKKVGNCWNFAISPIRYLTRSLVDPEIQRQSVPTSNTRTTTASSIHLSSDACLPSTAFLRDIHWSPTSGQLEWKKMDEELRWFPQASTLPSWMDGT
ncbi:hypothetical protein L3Y34_004249 [Caenorhabditis briggsae]|uniref:Uncharacterized protein n=1 Tax=Caenorhabditis briggsae TaxID=6238 RepID=A0AAE9D695_CAEBR|nr:hypothetical protein L3Y34_004249 [Caenorhabditis briggsae]